MEDQPKRLIRSTIRTPGNSVSHEALLATDVTTHPHYKGVFERLSKVSPDVVQKTIYGLMLQNERALMDKAFNQALEYPDPYPEKTRDELIAALTEDYRVYGLAKGLHQTTQFVRDIEKAAVAQANVRTH